jgi:hypothetical protein
VLPFFDVPPMNKRERRSKDKGLRNQPQAFSIDRDDSHRRSLTPKCHPIAHWCGADLRAQSRFFEQIMARLVPVFPTR